MKIVQVGYDERLQRNVYLFDRYCPLVHDERQCGTWCALCESSATGDEVPMSVSYKCNSNTYYSVSVENWDEHYEEE